MKNSVLMVLTNIPTPYRTNFFNVLAQELAARGDKLIVAYCAKSEWHRHWPFVPEANRYEHVFLRGFALKVGAFTIHFNPGILSLVWRVRPAWLLAAGAWNMPTGLMALAGCPGVTRTIFWSEGHQDAVINKAGLIARLRRFVLRRYDAFAVPNRRSRDFVRAESGWEVPCLPLPNTVDDTFFTPPTAGERKQLRRRLGLEPDDRVAVMVSRLEHRKGVQEACAALEALTLEHPYLRLVLIGTGTLEGELHREFAALLGAGRLVMPGNIGRQAVRDWLRAGDAFLLPSRRDPNPLSSIEAALCGLPLLLSRFVGNHGELADPTRPEWTIKEITTSEIARVLREAAKIDMAELRKAGLYAEQRARRDFTTRNVANRFVEALLELPRILA